jgi:NADPH:quinone reductase-like Zn-dependent oxidoreductase
MTKARLETLTDLFDNGTLTTRVGSVLPLEDARTAHEMLAGRPHAHGWSAAHHSPPLLRK